MINFTDFNILERDKVDAIFKVANFRTSDMSFANLYAWLGRFNSQMAVIEDTFFLRSRCSESDSCYMFPVGKMPLKGSIKMVMEDAKERNLNFKIIGATRKMFDLLNSEIPYFFEYQSDRDASDYIYLSEKLISLSGKKLQAKRNHINKFKSENPTWKYTKITEKTEIDNCFTMLKEWENAEKERLTKSQWYEYQAVRKMLENFEALKLTVGAIYVNDKIVAFSIGEALSEDCFVVHCEKAFSDINGAYTIMNQEFVKNEAINFKYINREEDLGIENLRKAKLSYQPEILLEKGKIVCSD